MHPAGRRAARTSSVRCRKISIFRFGTQFQPDCDCEDEKDSEVQSGSINRVFVKRGGDTVSNEDLTLDLHTTRRENKVRVIIENGDDAPLPVDRVRALAY